MKSIMEEASSIIKAVEKGWLQAGKPQEFSIKIFEEPTKNFLGLTTKPAKIGIFFTEKVGQSPRQPVKAREEQPKGTAFKKAVQHPAQSPQYQNSKPTPRQVPKQAIEDRPEKRVRETWTPEMIETTQSWIKETLALMEKPQRDFAVETKNYYLKVSFPSPIFDDQEKERLLFRSFAHLIMQSLRNKFKKSFRGFKVILSSPY